MLTKIIPIPAFKDNYIWLLINRNTKTAICVDPGEAIPVFSTLQSLQIHLKGILLTHHHFDHTGGVSQLLKKYAVPVYGPKHDPIERVQYLLKEGDHVKIDGFPKFHVLDIPGHTAGHIAYYNDALLFCGDTLFAGGCGRIFEGTPLQMYQSLQKITQLPDEIEIYCAHEYTLANLKFALLVEPENQKLQQRLKKISHIKGPTLPSTLAEEKDTNPFLRCHLPSIKHAAEHHCQKTLANPIDVFSVIREWKNGL